MAIGFIDLVVLLLYIAAVIAVGLWAAGRPRDLTSYLVGGRSLPWLAILGSIVATETSTATFLSVPGLAFVQGGDLRFLQLALGYIVGRITIVYLLLPLYFRGQLFTAYEVLDQRFGGTVKRTASLIFLVTRNLGDGLRLYLTAIVLQKVADIPLPMCIAVIGVATIIYTVIGGIKSVIWNDCIQLVVYMLGGIVVAVMIINRLPGGGEQVLAFARAHGKLRVFDPSFSLSNTYSIWAGLVGGAVLSLGTHGTDQMMVQRYLCARSLRDAAKALIGSGFFVFAQFGFFLLLGVALACFYDNFQPGRELAGDDALATFVVEQLPKNVGIIGFILAAVFSAAMSTLSSSLNSSASAVVNDLHVRTEAGSADERSLLAMSRSYTVLFGVLQIGIGIAASGVTESVVSSALAIAGFSAGLLLGVFLLGVLTSSINQFDAMVGLLIGLVCLLVTTFVLPRYGYAIAWPWWALIGCGATYIAGALCNLIRSSKTSAAAS